MRWMGHATLDVTRVYDHDDLEVDARVGRGLECATDVPRPEVQRQADLANGLENQSDRAVAQLAEHRSPKPGVAGSPPVCPATQTAPKIFITGDPGSGKTTAIRRIVAQLGPHVAVTGFLTEEVREGERRVGFRGTTLDGRSFTLAHVRHGGSPRVGPYGVNVASLEEVGVPALEPGPHTRLVVVDEVGKMESFSTAFREAVERLLEAPVAVLGTVAKHGVGLPKRVRSDPRVTLVELKRASRAGIVGEVLRLLERGGIRAESGRGQKALAAGRRPG